MVYAYKKIGFGLHQGKAYRTAYIRREQSELELAYGVVYKGSTGCSSRLRTGMVRDSRH